ncbi:DNA repair protein RecN [Xylanibacter oryzae]|uniref:DNA repair protein RecN n=1 Tax=Xylanibacter oryzae TaxID=185293 RepID=UPI0004BC2E4B|nr:DNA repair protein RecN [Xylanibacter oryzae]
MLTKLYIKNFTIIDTLDIDFSSGFSVITGETGAGKSIIIGAIGLLLGQRADSKVIKDGTEKCIIEAHFDLSKYSMKSYFDDNNIDYEDSDCIIRRELSTNGKSRSFINDTPAPLSVLKSIGEKLIDVHSQHQNLLLQHDDFQLEVVDIIAGDSKDLDEYSDIYTKYKDAKKEVQRIKESIQNKKENKDFLRFQFEELNKANLVEGEQEQLEQTSSTMNHAEEIKNSLFNTDTSLSDEGNGIIQKLRYSAAQLHNIEDVYPEVKELAQRIDDSYIELKDIADEISTRCVNIDFDPKELDEITSKLDTIYSLQQKHHCTTVKELIDLRESINQQLQDIENGDDILLDIQNKANMLEQKCIEKAKYLSAERRKSSKIIEKDVLKRLQTLGLPKVRFEIEFQHCDLCNNGNDKVSFMFSANPGTQLQQVSQVASGGEIARLMLSLKAMISGAVKLPTIIFDEIDTGVSGSIAEKMARIMQEMANNDRQVISITHLPQIAAMGTTHYKVYKEQTSTGTKSNMKKLSADERIKEIAQMLSGSTLTKAALQNAKELLNQI